MLPPEEIEKLLKSVQPYARWLAESKYYQGSLYTKEDIYCSAMYGAWQAAIKYNGDVKFLTYARRRMAGQVRDDIRTLFGRKYKMPNMMRGSEIRDDKTRNKGLDAVLEYEQKDMLSLAEQVARAVRGYNNKDKFIIYAVLAYGMKQRDVAELVGVHEARVSQVIIGARRNAKVRQNHSRPDG